MARWALTVVLALVAACGRVGFDERRNDGGGSGDAGDASAPIGFSQLVAYADQTCAVFAGAAYCWGDNNGGKLGVAATVATAAVPTAVDLLPGTVQALAMGANHGCAIVDGALYCYGNLGSGPRTPVALPSTPTAVSAGNDINCVIVGTAVYCWGMNAATGALAYGDTNPRTSPTATLLVATTAISIGDDHGCAIENGAAVCWGHNDDGTLGNGQMSPANNPTPTAVVGSPAVLPHIAGWHACMLAGGTVSCWGEGDHGELGTGGMTNTATPQVITSLSNVQRIAVGGGPTDLDATCAIVAGVVKCWGNGSGGRLGQGTMADAITPTDGVGLPFAATEIAVGYAHACALLVDGNLWCWGRGTKGQLGDGMSASSLAPVRVIRPG